MEGNALVLAIAVSGRSKTFISTGAGTGAAGVGGGNLILDAGFCVLGSGLDS